MNKLLIILFTIFVAALTLNTVCFASSEDVTVLLNKQITIKYGDDRNSSGGYTEYDDGYYVWNIQNDFEFNDYAFYAKSENDDGNEYSHYSNEVFPISYEGTTYLPIRSVSGLLWTGIAWDGDTNSVKIGDGSRDWRAIDIREETNQAESQYITALRNEDIKIYFNDELQTFKDANGKIVYPLSYNGTTYLPIRACANLFNMLIDWDGETNTVILTKKSSKKALIDTDREYIALARYNDEELEILLNEFFAKYGHDFDSKKLAEYFSLKDWYKKVDGKKVSTSELTSREQRIVENIKKEVERRKTFKDINTIDKPNIQNNKDFKVAKILQDSLNNDYVKIYDNINDALKAEYKESNISNIELIPSKVFLMNNSNKLYCNYNGETYYIPVEKVNSKDKERIVLMEDGLEIYNNGDLIIKGKRYEDFFNTKILKNLDGMAPKDLIDYLVLDAPKKEAGIGLKCNFDNDVNTSEYVFNVIGEEFEAGANFFDAKTKYMYLDKNSNVITISQIDDIDYNTNIDGYSNLFVKTDGWFDDLEEGYDIKYYAVSMLSGYIKENFIDAYYLFVPGKGFELVNKTLDGENVDITKYVFSLKSDLKLYKQEKYINGEYRDIKWLQEEIDISKYNRVLYCFNDNWDDEGEVRKNMEYEVVIPEGTKVRCVYTKGWWNIILESEDGKEAYVIYYTPAGVT